MPERFGSIADALEQDWHAKARPEQLPPAGDWFVWLILAGRGWGKSRTGAEWVRSIVESGQARRIALVAPTAADARDVMVRGPSGLLSISSDWCRPEYEPSKRLVTWPNGAEATLFSAEEPDRLRGFNHDAAWTDELCAWSNMCETWDMLMFTLRLGQRPRVLASTTPRPVKLIRDLMRRPDIVITRGGTADNAANLAPSFLAGIIETYAGTRLGRQELDAEILEDVEGALWSRAMIESARVATWPGLRRIVVAIDPAVTSGETSDETGIVVVGLGDDGHGYVLADASGRFAPIEWAQKAVTLYHRYGADRVVAEVNQGGDMVEATLRMVDPNVSYRGVHATRGKIIRAEPISALYEQGRVHHVGAFPALEDQMTSFEPGSRKSPDRLDALVWALTELMVGVSTGGLIDFYRDEAEAHQAGQIAGPTFGWAISDSAGTRGPTVRLIAPPGTTTIVLMNGRTLTPDPDGVVTCPKAEAGSLRVLGWPEIPAILELEGTAA